MRERISSAMIRGRVRAYHVPDLAQHSRQPRAAFGAPVTGWQHNDILYEWGAIIGNLLLRKGLNYGISHLYIEYENVDDPDDPVVTPTVTRDPEEGVSYYNGQVTSPTRDYLRVPLTAGVLNVSDTINFPKGNVPTFFAMTSGVTGVHGKTFSDSVNSKVFGGALVAAVDENDAAQDLVLSRFYFTASQQVAKAQNSQIGIEWQLELG